MAYVQSTTRNDGSKRHRMPSGNGSMRVVSKDYSGNGSRRDAQKEAKFREETDPRRTLKGDPKDTVGSYLTEWSKDAKRGLVYASQYNIDWAINKLKVWVGDTRLEEFSGDSLMRIKESAETEGLAPITTRKIMRAFKSAILDAIAEELVPPNAVAVLKTKKAKIVIPEGRSIPPLRSIEETEELAAALRPTHPDLSDMLIVAAYTGLRYGEIAGLDWQQVNFKTGKITVDRTSAKGPNGYEIQHRTKTKAGYRDVPLAPQVRAVLTARDRQLSGTIFTTKKGEPIQSPTASIPLKKAAAKLGVAHGWHCSRHYWCSLLIERGVPITTISTLMGHRSVKTTMHEYSWCLSDPTENDLVLEALGDSPSRGVPQKECSG